jgi:hypothetical protein
MINTSMEQKPSSGAAIQLLKQFAAFYDARWLIMFPRVGHGFLYPVICA